MPNKNRDKLNQPPTGEGKQQSPQPGAETKLDKRSEVLQATNAEQNIGTNEDEASHGEDLGINPRRPKAGR